MGHRSGGRRECHADIHALADRAVDLDLSAQDLSDEVVDDVHAEAAAAEAAHHAVDLARKLRGDVLFVHVLEGVAIPAAVPPAGSTRSPVTPMWTV